jgi:hypothetical protein
MTALGKRDRRLRDARQRGQRALRQATPDAKRSKGPPGLDVAHPSTFAAFAYRALNRRAAGTWGR